MVPSMESPINESMSQFVFAGSGFTWREYHAQLSVLRSFEWVASEWSHDHNLVGFNAHKLLITSHLASARISSGVLSHKSDDSGSRLPPGNDSGQMDEQSKISGWSNASSKESLDSVMALHSRHSSTPKMVMKGISSNITKPLLNNEVGKRGRRTVVKKTRMQHRKLYLLMSFLSTWYPILILQSSLKEHIKNISSG